MSWDGRGEHLTAFVPQELPRDQPYRLMISAADTDSLLIGEMRWPKEDIAEFLGFDKCDKHASRCNGIIIAGKCIEAADPSNVVDGFHDGFYFAVFCFDGIFQQYGYGSSTYRVLGASQCLSVSARRTVFSAKLYLSFDTNDSVFGISIYYSSEDHD